MSWQWWVEATQVFLKWATWWLFGDLKVKSEAVQRIEAETSPELDRLRRDADAAKADADAAMARAYAQAEAMTPEETARRLQNWTDE